MGARFEPKADRIEALVAKGRRLHAEAVRTILLVPVAVIVRAIREHRERRRRAHSFGTMNPHLLRDIGLTRTEVKAGRATVREAPTPASRVVVHMLPGPPRPADEAELRRAA